MFRLVGWTSRVQLLFIDQFESGQDVFQTGRCKHVFLCYKLFCVLDLPQMPRAPLTMFGVVLFTCTLCVQHMPITAQVTIDDCFSIFIVHIVTIGHLSRIVRGVCRAN